MTQSRFASWGSCNRRSRRCRPQQRTNESIATLKAAGIKGLTLKTWIADKGNLTRSKQNATTDVQTGESKPAPRTYEEHLRGGGDRISRRLARSSDLQKRLHDDLYGVWEEEYSRVAKRNGWPALNLEDTALNRITRDARARFDALGPEVAAQIRLQFSYFI